MVVATPSVNPSEAAVVRNTRYVGALSRNDESSPVDQKNSQDSVSPSCPQLLLRIARAGIMVMNMPIKSFATSAMVRR